MPNAVFPIDQAGGDQVYNWDLNSYVGTPHSSPGIVRGGHSVADFESKRFEGVAHQERIQALMNEYNPTLQVYATVDTKPLMQNAIRGAAAQLPLLKTLAGSPLEAWLTLGCKIARMRWSFNDMTSALDVDFDFIGLSASGVALTGVTQAVYNGPVMMAITSVATINGIDFGITSANGEINNNVHPRTHAGGKTTGFVRDPTHHEEGREAHTLRVMTLEPLNWGPVQDSPPSSNLVFAFTDGITPTPGTITLTYTGVFTSRPTWNQEIKTQGEVMYENTFWGAKACLAIS